MDESKEKEEEYDDDIFLSLSERPSGIPDNGPQNREENVAIEDDNEGFEEDSVDERERKDYEAFWKVR